MRAFLQTARVILTAAGVLYAGWATFWVITEEEGQAEALVYAVVAVALMIGAGVVRPEPAPSRPPAPEQPLQPRHPAGMPPGYPQAGPPTGPQPRYPGGPPTGPQPPVPPGPPPQPPIQQQPPQQPPQQSYFGGPGQDSGQFPAPPAPPPPGSEQGQRDEP